MKELQAAFEVATRDPSCVRSSAAIGNTCTSLSIKPTLSLVAALALASENLNVPNTVETPFDVTMKPNSVNPPSIPFV